MFDHGAPNEGLKLGDSASKSNVSSQRKRPVNGRSRKGRHVHASPRARLELRLRLSTSRKAHWRTFIEKYERFTDVLCAAAKHGISPEGEIEYGALRSWFMDHYYDHAPRLRQQMHGFAFAPGAGGADGQPMDTFEAIFLPRTLVELLAHDDGNLIGLVSSVSQAIYSLDA